MLALTMHVAACIWVAIGTNNTGTWVDDGNFRDAGEFTLYITSLYWVVTTLTTVGYGDIIGFTKIEYTYTMMVEFVGIGFFSFIMGSIQNALFNTV